MGALTSQLGARVYLDANIIIYAVEGFESHAAKIKSLLSAMTEGALIAVTSDLTLAEVLVKPKREANANLEEAYRRFLLPTDVFRNVAITREIFRSCRRHTRNQCPKTARCYSLGIRNSSKL